AAVRIVDLRLAAPVSDQHHFIQPSAHCASRGDFIPPQNSIDGVATPSKPTLSTVSTTPRRSFLIALGDFQNPSHHQRILDRTAIIVASSTYFRESTRPVKRARTQIRFTNLEKGRPHSATAKLDQHRVEHLTR